MGKIRKIFSTVYDSIKESLKKFPITMVIVYFTTLICTFGTDDFIETFMDDAWFAMMGIWAIGTLFFEIFFKKDLVKIIGGVASFVIALGCRAVIIRDEVSANFILEKLVTIYVTVIPLITLYKIAKVSGFDIKQYALRVLSNVGKTTTTYALANLGILVVMLVFIELILDGNDYDILPRTLILLLGGFYVPAMLNAITDVTQETGKFLKALLTRILMPVAIFLIGTLYLYVVKIMMSGELLNKALFFVLSLTFSLSIPCVILLKNYEENKSVQKMSNVILYSFIPLLVLQIIAMNVRVADYGLTEARYMGYLLIAFEIIFIALMIIKKAKYLDTIILVFAGFIIFGVISPFNVFDVPVYSQTARIEKILRTANSFDELTIEQKNECKKAYIYVENGSKPEYLDKKLTEEEKETIKKYIVVYNDNDYAYRRDTEYEHVSVYDRNAPVNIDGFKMLYLAYNSYYYGNKVDIDFERYELKDKEGIISVTVDIKDLVKQMSEAEKNNKTNETFEKVRYMKTSDENIMFYMTEFSMSYELYSNSLEHFSIEGYLLVK